MRDWSPEIRRRLAPLDLEPTREAEIAEEIAQHLDDRYDELRAGGLADDAARRAALAELREHELLSAELHGVERPAAPAAPLGARGGRGWASALAHDLRYAARALRGAPGYTAIALVTLGLAIGACTLIFSAVNGVLLRPLPFRDPGRLIAFYGTAPEKGLPELVFPEALVHAFGERSRAVESLAAYGSAGFNLTGVGEPERVEGAPVSRDFFRVLGVAPRLGRTFAAGEDVRGASPVVVVSDALWRRRLGADPKAVGRTIELNGERATVVGVMPPGFGYPGRSDVWSPLPIDPARVTCWCWAPIARLRPGVTPEAAGRDLAAVADAFWRERAEGPADPSDPGTRIRVKSLVADVVGDVRRPLVVLLAAVGAVLLIACANVANLALARATGRARELAVRCCIGAAPRRIASQLLAEALLLSLGGSALGLLLCTWGVRLLRRLPADQIPRIDEVRVDPRVLLFTTLVAVATGVLCGLAPALRAWRVNLQDAVKAGTRGTASGRARRVSDGFVVAQFALSLVLLAGTGLLLRSYRHLLAVDPGFRPDSVLVARLQLPAARYDTAPEARALYDALLARVEAIPGVRAAGLGQRVPLTRGNPQDNIIAEGKEPKRGEPVRVANIRIVSPGYFAAMGTPLLRGRGFLPTDDQRGLRVTVVDEGLARFYWPNEDAVGKRIRHQGDTSAGAWMTIVGVVANVKHSRLDEPTDLQLYEPFAQRTTWTNYLVVRATSAPEALVPELRRAVAALDPALPLYEVHTMASAVDRSLGARRLTNLLLAGFAATALLLAAVGVYGVVSLTVTGRVREFGVRMALGARTGDVGRLVLRHGLMLAGAGVAAGLAAAVGLTRFLRGLLFGVSPVDWATFAGVALLLTGAALAACWVPARRATRADPLTALRAE
jgi:putative ABC transport system permease protein